LTRAEQRATAARERAKGFLPYGERFDLYYGAIYESGYDRAALAEPIWTCGHAHDHPDLAHACALEEIERRGEKVAR
jgi:hypothetical protein